MASQSGSLDTTEVGSPNRYSGLSAALCSARAEDLEPSGLTRAAWETVEISGVSPEAPWDTGIIPTDTPATSRLTVSAMPGPAAVPGAIPGPAAAVPLGAGLGAGAAAAPATAPPAPATALPAPATALPGTVVPLAAAAAAAAAGRGLVPAGALPIGGLSSPSGSLVGSLGAAGLGPLATPGLGSLSTATLLNNPMVDPTVAAAAAAMASGLPPAMLAGMTTAAPSQPIATASAAAAAAAAQQSAASGNMRLGQTANITMPATACTPAHTVSVTVQQGADGQPTLSMPMSGLQQMFPSATFSNNSASVTQPSLIKPPANVTNTAADAARGSSSGITDITTTPAAVGTSTAADDDQFAQAMAQNNMQGDGVGTATITGGCEGPSSADLSSPFMPSTPSPATSTAAAAAATPTTPTAAATAAAPLVPSSSALSALGLGTSMPPSTLAALTAAISTSPSTTSVATTTGLALTHGSLPSMSVHSSGLQAALAAGALMPTTATLTGRLQSSLAPPGSLLLPNMGSTGSGNGSSAASSALASALQAQQQQQMMSAALQQQAMVHAVQEQQTQQLAAAIVRQQQVQQQQQALTTALMQASHAIQTTQAMPDAASAYASSSMPPTTAAIADDTASVASNPSTASLMSGAPLGLPSPMPPSMAGTTLQAVVTHSPSGETALVPLSSLAVATQAMSAATQAATQAMSAAAAPGAFPATAASAVLQVQAAQQAQAMQQAVQQVVQQQQAVQQAVQQQQAVQRAVQQQQAVQAVQAALQQGAVKASAAAGGQSALGSAPVTLQSIQGTLASAALAPGKMLPSVVLRSAAAAAPSPGTANSPLTAASYTQQAAALAAAAAAAKVATATPTTSSSPALPLSNTLLLPTATPGSLVGSAVANPLTSMLSSPATAATAPGAGTATATGGGTGSSSTAAASIASLQLQNAMLQNALNATTSGVNPALATAGLSGLSPASTAATATLVNALTGGAGVSGTGIWNTLGSSAMSANPSTLAAAQAALPSGVTGTDPRFADKVKVLLCTGGYFMRVAGGAAGAGSWEYGGGETRLVSLPRVECLVEVCTALAKAAGCEIAEDAVLKYQLPGTPDTLVDLLGDDDVINMWEALDEQVGLGKPSYKLKLLLQAHGSSRGVSAVGTNSAGSGQSTHCNTSGHGGHGGNVGGMGMNTGSAGTHMGTTAGCCGQASGGPRSGGTHGTTSACSAATQPSRGGAGGDGSTSSSMMGGAGFATAGTGFSTATTGMATTATEYELGVLREELTGMMSTAPRVGLSELEAKLDILRPEDLTVLKFLGSGGYGEVYLCRWHNVDVAVKCLSPSLLVGDSAGSAAASDIISELLKEAAMLGGLRHPNVVWVYGVVLPGQTQSVKDKMSRLQDASQDIDAVGLSARMSAGMPVLPGMIRPPALVAEYMAAGSLRAALSRNSELVRSNLVRVKLALDAARGMAYLHARHIVHFDLKTGNLLVGFREKAPCCKVADFGLSKQRQQTYVTGITSLRGTLPWTAPEIIRTPKAVTEKVDVYSFGIVMWELWTGKEPFDGLNYHALLHQLSMSSTPMRPALPGAAEWEGPCPPEPAIGWSNLMQRCWSELPAARPSFVAVVSELEAMLDALKAKRRAAVIAGI